MTASVSTDDRGHNGPPAESTYSLLPVGFPGHWYLNRDGQRLTLTVLAIDGGTSFRGTTAVEGSDATAEIDAVAVDATGAVASFCAHEASGDVWYALHLEHGVMAGRWARVPAGSGRPGAEVAYDGRVTGWRDETFSADVVPRVFDILIDGRQEAGIRIDRRAPGAMRFVGRMKMYALDGELAEQLAEDVEVDSWDGTNLSFVRRSSPAQERFIGKARGRTIAGTVSPTAGPSAGTSSPWTGQRMEVLGHGLGAKDAAAWADWQALTRLRLGLLAMGGNPAPIAFQVTELGTRDPPPDSYPNTRDDEPEKWPQRYALTELSFDSTVRDLGGGAPLARKAHGFVAVPTTPAPPGGYPVVLAINGHTGSAWQVFEPGSWFWYGDSFARRGYLVISVDIGHRPYEDRAAYYNDECCGDDPANGNGVHPAIKAAGMTSDWEEDGERAWDSMRALDYALARSDVNRDRVSMVGLSMGGEITDLVTAMDVRIGTSFPVGSPADWTLMALYNNHPCWRWQRGEAHEYFDPGDLAAMTAPRLLVRETGRFDNVYSALPTPFSPVKELVRGAQPAFDALGGHLVHYLHFDGHAFHVGDFCPALGSAAGVTVPVEAAPDPSARWSNVWDADATTAPMTSSIFDLLPG